MPCILSDHDNIQHPISMVLFFVLSMETLQRFLKMHQINQLINSQGKKCLILSHSAYIVSLSFVTILFQIQQLPKVLTLIFPEKIGDSQRNDQVLKYGHTFALKDVKCVFFSQTIVANLPFSFRREKNNCHHHKHKSYKVHNNSTFTQSL